MVVIDEFGVREIYATNTHPNRAKPWYMGIGNWSDRRFTGIIEGAIGDWNDCPINDVNPYEINFDTDGKKGRLPVLAQPLDDYPGHWPNPHEIVTGVDQSYLRKRGYMAVRNDWKNVEITLYWKVKETMSEEGTRAMQISVRGGPHHGDDGDCAGTALYVDLGYDWKPETQELHGYAYLQKELGHTYYTCGIYKGAYVTDGNILDKWIGIKGVFYNKANGNPYIELWLDKNPENAINNWKLEMSTEDDGNWYLKPGKPGEEPECHGEKHNYCGGKDNERVTWGGPGVIFKLDGLTTVDMKWLSVREILPPEGWPLRYLLNARGVSPPYSMRALAQEYGLTAPISLRQLTELEAERYPFS